MRILFSLIAIGGAAAYSATAPTTNSETAPTATEAAIVEPAPVHCQVPCGVYGDKMRIDMLLEDAATIEKAMQAIAAEDTNKNQGVRWIMNKESHAQNIQDMVAAYWLTQRIKAPKEGDDDAKGKYLRQLALMHQLTVSAMKCKQTTDVAHVETLRKTAAAFSATYFSEEDLKHLREHSFAGH
ncbi:MAG: superoxide dismutase [Ni] [Planctomycetota bacterium]|nr:superoxide dismutase [Ni] [Planctomycetota bacterium]